MIIIFGTGPLAKLALEVFQQNDLMVYGLLTEQANDTNQEINHTPILGHMEDEQYLALLNKDCHAFIALEQAVTRKKLVKTLQQQEEITFINAIHPLAHIASSVSAGHNNLIHMGTMLGLNVKLGSHCLLNQQVAVEQDVAIKDFVQIGAASVIGAQATIEEGAFIGTGTTVIAGIRIGVGARIGAGSVVLDHVPAGATVLGNPAKPIQA